MEGLDFRNMKKSEISLHVSEIQTDENSTDFNSAVVEAFYDL
jgi:hypothetical protein